MAKSARSGGEGISHQYQLSEGRSPRPRAWHVSEPLAEAQEVERDGRQGMAQMDMREPDIARPPVSLGRAEVQYAVG